VVKHSGRRRHWRCEAANPGVAPGADHAREKSSIEGAASSALVAGQAWVEPIESGIRGRIRERIEELVEQELASALRRARNERGSTSGHRHGCVWPLTGSFGPVERSVSRVRLHEPNGTERKRRSAVLPNDARRTRQMEALIASASLSGPTPRRVQRGLAVLLRSAVGKDVVSRARRKVKADGDAWCRRDLAGEAIVRLILDGAAVTVRLDRKALSPSLLVGHGIRCDGQKVLLATRTTGRESARPPGTPCWMTSGHLRCRAVAESLDEAGEALVALTRLPASQGRSARTTNAIERLHEECTRRITTQNCPRERPRRCWSWRCAPSARSPCARSTDGRASVSRSLTASFPSPPAPIASPRRERHPRMPTTFATSPSGRPLTDSLRTAPRSCPPR
jgi:transposase-like protein